MTFHQESYSCDDPSLASPEQRSNGCLSSSSSLLSSSSLSSSLSSCNCSHRATSMRYSSSIANASLTSPRVTPAASAITTNSCACSRVRLYSQYGGTQESSGSILSHTSPSGLSSSVAVPRSEWRWVKTSFLSEGGFWSIIRTSSWKEGAVLNPNSRVMRERRDCH